MEALRGSVVATLKADKVKARVASLGSSVRVEGPEPVRVAETFRFTPGVSWIAVGESASSFKALVAAGAGLARKYLRRGDGFVVLSEAGGGSFASDVSGAIVSACLEAVRGSRVREEAPKVIFRAALDGAQGAVGVQITAGPGGIPTGPEEVACLVSGGRHSAVVAWAGLLAGYRLKLVHSMVDESSLLAVARLYSELSHRVAPGSMSLVVLESEAPSAALEAWVLEDRGTTFGGFHTGGAERARLARRVRSPLFLLPEEEFTSRFEGLSIVEHGAEAGWKRARSTVYGVLKFDGGRAEVSDVLDGLRRPRRS